MQSSRKNPQVSAHHKQKSSWGIDASDAAMFKHNKFQRISKNPKRIYAKMTPERCEGNVIAVNGVPIWSADWRKSTSIFNVSFINSPLFSVTPNKASFRCTSSEWIIFLKQRRWIPKGSQKNACWRVWPSSCGIVLRNVSQNLKTCKLLLYFAVELPSEWRPRRLSFQSSNYSNNVPWVTEDVLPSAEF